MNARASRARRGGQRRTLGGRPCETLSGNARSCCECRWRTRDRCLRPTCSRCTDGSSPRPGRSRRAIDDGVGTGRATTARADPGLTSARRTRFAPAPTGYLHLGHVANALWTWGLARATGGRMLLRIEDHDRQRSRAEYDAALLEDLAWLGFAADDGPLRQTDDAALDAYAAAADRLRADGR